MDKSLKKRNIAIIAHVDHGKTTLVDQLLSQTGTVDTEGFDRVMDSDAIEKERGITILAKQTGISYNGYHINIIDTPGHADFGGEVERTLQMVEGFLLLVDAAEGVLPGTRFVLQKALALNLKPIVFINKIDRQDAAIEQTEDMIHDLFLDLAKHEEQLNFPVLYGSSKFGFATTDASIRTDSMLPLLDTIIDTIPCPVARSEYLQLLVTNLDYSDFLGTIVIGRVFSGSLRVGDPFVLCYDTHTSGSMKVRKLYTFKGLERIETDEVSFGDVVAIAGFDEPVTIGSTICSPGHLVPLEYVPIDEPTLSMYMMVNDSPFNGRSGKLLTSRQIKERLEKELKTNVALRVEDTESPEKFKVSGRGQLHLSVLIENMRREGFELQISAPEVIYKTINGTKHEPIEAVMIDVDQEHQGVIMEKLGIRKAELKNVTPQSNGRVQLEFEVPARGLLGFRSQFLTDTRGTGILNVRFLGYQPFKGAIPTRTKGALVSMENGMATGYALGALEPRGVLFISPGEQIYQGMIIGEHSRDNDLDVNPCKTKKLTNMRASGTDDSVKLSPAKRMELEIAMEWICPDELVEVTPDALRLRKKQLRAALRKKE